MHHTEINALITGIYDCAAAPELWPGTLEKIRDRMDAAYVSVFFADFSVMPLQSAPIVRIHTSPWDISWFRKFETFFKLVPNIEQILRLGIDTPWTQIDQIPEAEFKKTVLYKEWAGPQGLRDVINTMYFDRKGLRGTLTIASGTKRDIFNDRDKQIAAVLSPHIRRALAINDIVDKGNMALALYRKVIDSLSVAVFVAGAGGQLKFTNAKGDAMLSTGDVLRLERGMLRTCAGTTDSWALETAIDRAVAGDAALGISGIGVPLKGPSDVRMAAYVLPLDGKTARGGLAGGDLATGCAAIFVTGRNEQLPMVVEVLRTLYGLTPAEARTASAAASGQSPQVIADSQGNSVDTVRYHLKNVYAKMGIADRVALATAVHGLTPPVAAE